MVMRQCEIGEESEQIATQRSAQRNGIQIDNPKHVNAAKRCTLGAYVPRRPMTPHFVREVPAPPP
jgi:hypothetical protein